MYLYNGKELQKDFGLDWYDYGARFYDAELGRFISIDSLADEFPYKSPYDYAENKPINCIDLDGLEGLDMIRYSSMTALTDPAGFSKQTDRRNEAVNSIKEFGGKAWSKGVEAGKNSPLNNVSKNGYVNGTLNMVSGAYIFSSGVAELAATPETEGMSTVLGIGSIAYGSSQFIFGGAQIINEAKGNKKDLPQGPVSLLGADIDNAAKTDGTFEKAGEFIENAVNIKTVLTPKATNTERILNGTSLFFNLNNYVTEPKKTDDIQK